LGRDAFTGIYPDLDINTEPLDKDRIHHSYQ
jgi:hypothetical protein